MESEDIPEQWKSSTIILLHKNGPKDDLNNYRPISLMSNLYKLFTKIITRRLTQILDENQPPEQAGFRSGFSTADHLQALNQIIEKMEEFNLPLYIAFVDYKKAFDFLEHASVFQALVNQGVETKYVRLLKTIYSQSTAKVKTEKVGQTFTLGRGVKQGDPISPKLFTCVLEEIFRKLQWSSKCGITVNGRRLTNLRFADDVVLFATSHKQLQQMLRELNEISKSTGLEMNFSKTQLMTNKAPIPIKLEGTELNYVDEYIYLGQLVSLTSRMEKEIKRRVTQAWKAFWALKFILQNKSLNRNLRLQALTTCIFPVLLYGCQTWALTARQKNTLAVCQRGMERKILGISLKDRINNKRLQEITSSKNIVHEAARIKWRWGGHVVRLQGNRWAQITTTWDPYQGKRRPGRPRVRWADSFRQQIGTHWSRVAQCRRGWKELGRQLVE